MVDLAGAAAIDVAHLRKAYGKTIAVDDVSFTVGQGEIFGILGPNGAGKTTTVECVVGLRTPDQGTIRVLGLDPQRERAALHAVVGVQLQASALPAKLTVAEILDLYHAFYEHPADIGELIDALGLADKRNTSYKHLSGGQKHGCTSSPTPPSPGCSRCAPSAGSRRRGKGWARQAAVPWSGGCRSRPASFDA